MMTNRIYLVLHHAKLLLLAVTSIVSSTVERKGVHGGLWVMESAAFSGSLDCLRYACENGASWSFFDFDEGFEIFDDGMSTGMASRNMQPLWDG